MIGIIISGHGQFASGLYSSVRLIAGEQENIKAIDFEEGMSSEELSERLKIASEEIGQEDGVAIFTDIPGGTPFNQAVLLSTKKDNIKVISGTNLPALLDGMFSRNGGLEEFTTKVLDAGETGLQVYKPKEKQASDQEDGI